VLILGAVIVGVGVTIRFAPPLASSREGRLVFWIVANLVGAAAGVVVADVWTAARSLSNSLTIPGSFNVSSGLTESVVVGALEEILLEGSILIALASVIYLLGPRDRQDASAELRSRV
jgi:hypothetical protein